MDKNIFSNRPPFKNIMENPISIDKQLKIKNISLLIIKVPSRSDADKSTKNKPYFILK